MIKTLIYLLIVTQICCLGEDDKKFTKDDEVDVKTEKSIVIKDEPKEEPFDGQKDLPKDELIPRSDGKPNTDQSFEPNPAEGFPKDGFKPSDNGKPKEELPGNDQNRVDYKIPEKGGKPHESQPEIDLGKDFKKVVVKPHNPKEFEKDINENKDQFDYNFEEKVPNKGFDGEGGRGPDKDFDKDQKPLGPAPGFPHKNHVLAANEIIDHLLKLLRTDYRSEFEPTKLGDFEPFRHGRWGSVILHSGVVNGLSNVERVGDVVVVDEDDNKKLVITDIAVKDVIADYKMNAKLFHRISFKDRDLKLTLNKAVLSIKLLVDKNAQKLIVKSLNLKSTEGFVIRSGRLFWPFNKVTNAILKNQEKVIKDLIQKEFDKYMGKVVNNIQFDALFNKLF